MRVTRSDAHPFDDVKLMLPLVVVIGGLVGWGGGRLLALNGKHGIWNDVGAGVLGALGCATLLKVFLVPAPEALLVGVVGLGGALAATFVWRTYVDQYRRVIVVARGRR